MLKDSDFERLHQFQQPEKIQSLVLNNNRIAELEENAFINCRMINLQKVRIGNNLTHFYNCVKLCIIIANISGISTELFNKLCPPNSPQ